MPTRSVLGAAALFTCLAAAPPASAQLVEAVGSRALGMGGAFVAVASDSSATWWNPAGLAAGPYMDMALARAATARPDALPAWRQRVSWFALGTPPFGFGYYRFRITDIQPSTPTETDAGDRQSRRADLPVRSLSATQIGVTLVQTLIGGVHAGTTLKYLRGSVRTGLEDALLPTRDLLARGEDFDGGQTQGRFDFDVGVLAVAGPVRVGGVMRHGREPDFGGEPGSPGGAIRLPRQVRVGAAFDPELMTGRPLVASVDVDLRTYPTPSGDRRVVAAGAEHWFLARRLGVRAGGRFNTVGDREPTATGGVSVALRSGLYLDAHAVRGGSDGEEGWGLAARVSY